VTPPTPDSAPGEPLGCPVAEACGGCALIHLGYPSQLGEKRRRAVEALARYPELADVPLADLVRAPQVEGYRTRAKLACALHADGLRVGLYHPGTHDLTDIPGCPVLHPAVREVADAVRGVFSSAPFHELALSYVSVRYSRAAGRAHLTFVLGGDAPDLALQAAQALLARAPVLSGVTLNLNPGPPLRVFGPTFRPLAGEERLVEEIGGRRFPLGPGAFFQANIDQAEAVVKLVRDHLGEGHGRLVDFYAGAGVLALCLAEPEAEVVAIEAFPAAAQDAVLAARENGFTHFRMVTAHSERAAPALSAELGRADRVVVNPPRKGCAPAVLRALCDLRPERAAYVSCDPTTLARDLAMLARLGYQAKIVVPVDMLPQTDHLEAVALLEPSGARRRRGYKVAILYEDDAILVVDKPPHVPVQAGTGTGATILDLLAEERGETARGYRLVHRLDAETSGALVVAKDLESARRLGRIFAEGAVAKRYLCLVRGIAREKGVVNRPLAMGRDRLREARTKYRRLILLHGHSVVAATPETGRLHQIRRHLAQIGHPIVGDERYGDAATNRHFAERFATARVLLHAAAISFPHPVTGERIAVAAPVPGDFALVLERLGLARPIDTTRMLRDLVSGEAAPPPHRPPAGGGGGLRAPSGRRRGARGSR
jgi:23S rRNA (uracil1939-C5)-methyltransferase